MTATTFDTLAYSKKLKAVGVHPDQADVQAEALFELIDEKLATKRDLKELEERLTYKLTIRLGSTVVIACDNCGYLSEYSSNILGIPPKERSDSEKEDEKH
jgi:hypothetical protein